MVKITDIEGAKEALPKEKKSYLNIKDHKTSDAEYCSSYNECVRSVASVHLEVDVEAMALEIKDMSDDPKFQSLDSMTIENCKDIAKILSTNIPKWARLVRK